MVKLICFLKRNSSMNFEEFKRYYEQTHRKLGVEYLPEAFYYARRYIRPQDNSPVAGRVTPQDFDVITELWFEDEAGYNSAMARLAQPQIRKVIEEDERKLFDRDANRFFIVQDEHADVMTRRR